MQLWTHHALSFKIIYDATCYPAGIGCMSFLVNSLFVSLYGIMFIDARHCFGCLRYAIDIIQLLTSMRST